MKTLLLGDVCPTAATNPLYDAKDIATLFGCTTSLFAGNDVNIVNLECAITDSDKSILKFGPALKACKNTVYTLKELGVNYCGLSNNHIFDFGKKGAQDTMAALDEAGIGYTGFGKNYEDSRKNLVIEKDGESLCIIAVCEHEYSYALPHRMGSRPYDEYDTIDDVRNAKQKYDRVVVMYHGGKEQCRYPSPRLRKLCRALAKNGADVVLCQHSHCIGCYEFYEDCHILYGQGNFHFAKAEFLTPELEPYWNSSLAVKYDTKTNDIEFIPVAVNGVAIDLANGEQADEIMNGFYNRNEQLKTDEWKKGWHDFCISMKNQYYANVGNAATQNSSYNDNHWFAHYLDCEAHTDVFRELFHTANMTNEID